MGEQSNKLSYCFGKVEENMDVSFMHLGVLFVKSFFLKLKLGKNVTETV